MTPPAAPVSALPPAARWAAAALRTISRLGCPVLLIALLRATDPPLTTAVLARGLVGLVLLPELCARLVLRAFAAELRVEGGALRIAGALRRIEAPCRAIARASAWRIPLPSAGLALRLASGAKLRVGLATPRVAALSAALADTGVAVPPPGAPALAHAAAGGAWRRRWWDRASVKLGLTSLVPGAIGFNAHQHIAYGAFLGEYYLMGLRAWLTSAAGYWLTAALYLVLWAGCLRLALETLVWLGTLATPRRAGRLRRVGEHTATALYYASIPLLLALRFLA